MESEICKACGADMKSRLPVPLGQGFPIPWKEVGSSLAVGAGVLALRAGLHLARHLLERKAAKPPALRTPAPLATKTRRRLPRRRNVEEAASTQPQIRVWGQRVWGRWSSDGSSHVEVEEFDWQASTSGE
jgi:hypothetical protein